MLNSEIINSLIDVRIDMLYYWQTETDKEKKQKLSDKLNTLDKAIMSLQKKQESLNRLGVKK